MSDRSFALPVSDDPVGNLAGRWLKLGVLTLLAAGMYSILLVLARAPGIDEHMPLRDFFHVALVVHVDLSAVIWPLALAGVFWSLNASEVHPLWDSAALWLAGAGTALIAVSPFLGAGHPLSNSYIPVLRDPIFYAGGWIAMAGFVLLVLRAIVASRPLGKPFAEVDVLRAGIWFSAFAAVVSGLALGWSYWGVPRDLPPQAYLESLFWGSGHVLQFAHTLLLLVAWLWLADAAGFRLRLSPQGGVNLMAVALAPVLVAPVIYFNAEVTSAFHTLAFTRLMRYGGLTALPLGAVVVLAVLSGWTRASQTQRYLRAALYCSLVTFAAAGLLGFLVEGVGVSVPAHYRGSVAGVALAFMGMTYYLLPRLGHDAPMPRLANIQPYVYSGGQLMHIVGLAWSRDYGTIEHTTAGAVRGPHPVAEIAATAMALSGELVASIGVLLFVVVAIGSIWLRRKPV